ncbi:MAG TPA: hypothetical protein VNX01_06700 [Bacteroidia bacterium]|jgi:hypothetical protein|nr:hypothetical protein [Bacteroidia bacterium]
MKRISLGKLFTNVALFFGALAALSCISISLIKWGMFCSIIGIVCSVFVVFRRTQFALETKWYHPVFFALVLSSIPILYIVTIIFIFKE